MSLAKIKGIFFILFLLFFIPKFTSGQIIDSIKTSLQTKPRLNFNVDSRNSFITHYYARIRGVKLGLFYDNKVKIGLGFNWLSSSILRNEGSETVNNFEQPIYSALHFLYFSPYVEYAFYQNKRWIISIPVLFGAGWAYYQSDFPAYKTISQMQFVTIYEPYMTAEFKVFRYFSVGFGTGYRLIIVGTSRIRRELSSPIYVFNANILFGNLMKDFWKGK